MSIDSVTEMWSRQTGGVSSPDGRKYSASFASAYQVVHSADATTVEILDAVPVKLNDAYPGFSGVYCDKVGDRQTSGPILSIVPVTWSGETSSDNGEPEDKEPEIEYYSSTASEAADTDGYGIPFTNGNGELVDGITRDISDMVLVVNRNFIAINATTALQYLDSTNSDVYEVLGDTWLPGQAALQDFKIKPVYSGGNIAYFNVSARINFRQPYNTIPARAWWARYRNEGYYERVGTTATFSAPSSGETAKGYPIITSGTVAKIVVTDGGSGYTSAPTVTITDATGTGAAATAVLSGDAVASVTVGTPGSGYKSSIVEAVDDNKKPVTKPVLLKADGTRQKDSSLATWIERPKKTYSLPYSALGLI